MLRKCLKYDFRAVAKVWWIAAVTALVLTIPVGLCLRHMVQHSMDPDYFPWDAAGILLGYFTIFAVGIVTFILLFIRYYSNFFRDEGYLTFTLPVKRSTLFASKVINGLFWEIATALLICVGFCVVFAMAPEADSDRSMLQGALDGILEFFREGFAACGAWLVVYTVLVVIMFLLSKLIDILMMYLSITLGSVLARKHKVMATIGIYYGASSVWSILLYLFLFYVLFWVASAIAAYPNAVSTDLEASLLLALCLAFVDIVMGVICTVLAYTSLGTLERKLNLS